LEKSTPLPAEEIPFFRRVLGMELYLANQQRWLELQFPFTQAARGGAHPSTIDMWRVKRIAKYIVSHRATTSSLKDPTTECLNAVVDAEWAGDPETRRSTSGGLMLWRRCLLMSWSRTQRVLAMSSAESEYYSLTTRLQEPLYAKNILVELGIDGIEEVPIALETDSLGTKQASEKVGALHLRHVQLR
jgi:KUP system potassium uptake protein